MKITFIYPDIGYYADIGKKKLKSDKYGFFSEGVASLISILKKEKHKVSLIHIKDPLSEKEFLDIFSKTKPDIALFSTTTHMYRYTKHYAKIIKKNFDIPIIAGGVHVTLNPEEVIKNPSIDIVCVGEGEFPIKELINAIEKKKNYTKVKNIWVKQGSKIYKNPVRPLIENLDKIPLADIKSFKIQNLVPARTDSAYIMLSRGCPFNCTYCSNHSIREIYPNKNKYARFRSVDNSIKYIKQYLKEYPEIKQIDFCDDTLNLYKDWFKEFMKKYKKEIGLPFQCRCRANLVDEETIKLLKQAGCYYVLFGVESGNDFMLQKVLKRNMTKKDIYNAFSLCKKYGIRTLSYNMVGLPFENLYTMLETIKLNALVSDKSQCFIFYPYPNTELYNICKKNNLLTDKEFNTYLEGTLLKQKTVTEAEVLFAHTFFNPLIKLYKLYYKMPFSMLFIGITDSFFCFRYKPHKLMVNTYNLSKRIFYGSVTFLHNHFPRLYVKLRAVYIGKDKLKQRMARKVEV